MLELINSEIEALLQEEPSYSVIQKLAWLYIVRDHIDKEL